MSKLAALDQLLEQYQQLSYHTDPILEKRLHELTDELLALPQIHSVKDDIFLRLA